MTLLTGVVCSAFKVSFDLNVGEVSLPAPWILHRTMTTRRLFVLPSLLIGAIAMAQEDVPDTRLIPDIGSDVVIEMAAPHEPDSNAVLVVVEEMPSFPGGMPALFAYVSEHLQYPAEAKERRVEGMVLMQFTVERDGSISDIQVIRGIGSGCDEAARRVVQQMPAWKPGQQGGKPVRVRYSLPIRFKLTD